MSDADAPSTLPASIYSKPCPKCGAYRLLIGPPLGAPGKLTCCNCGSTFQRKAKR